jgi:hypothetical protein
MIWENTLGLTNQTYSPQLRDDPPGMMKKTVQPCWNRPESSFGLRCYTYTYYSYTWLVVYLPL